MSQNTKIKELLEQNGRVSRNYCLRNFITSRLAARIDDLEREGYQFKQEKVDGDYVYVLLAKPAPKQIAFI